MHVLLVDDDHEDYLLIREVMDEAFPGECKLDWASTYADALARYKPGHYAIIFIDINLGPDNGLDLIREIRQRDASAPPCVLITGIDDPVMESKAFESGADNYVVKHELSAPTMRKIFRYARLRKEYAAAIHESEVRMRNILNTMNDGFCTFTEKGAIRDFNPAFIELFGYTEEQLRDMHVQKIIPLLDDAWLNQREGRIVHRESVGLRNNGEEVPVEINVNEFVLGENRYFTLITHDITERKLAAQRITRQAMYDALTDLPNRRLFMDRLERSLSNAYRSGHNSALLFIDLDKFKMLNDTHGHSAGDQLLVAVAKRLKQTVRDSDTVARLGGDEFVVILNNLDNDAETAVGQAGSVAEKLLQILAEPHALGRIKFQCPASIGLTVFPAYGGDCDTLLSSADDAMYASKLKGGQHVTVFRGEEEASASK